MLSTVDLFAGCGGLSLGFENAGYKVLAAFEFWQTAANCYTKNFHHPVHQMDLSDTDKAIQLIAQYAPDIIIGGPPCQDFSSSGKRQEAGRANLTRIFATIISEIKPRYFIMENVDRAAKSNAYADARKIYKAAGYGLTEVILDASKCGVPQKRKRFFCIGVLGEHDGALDEIIEYRQDDKSTTLRDYFGNSLGIEFYYRHPRNYNRRAIFSIDEPAPTMRGVNRPIPQGYPGHPNDACPLNDTIRSLTTAERALVQTFPSDFVWSGSKTEIEQMIGNAVPVKFAEFVACALKEYIDMPNNPSPLDLNNSFVQQKEAFKEWLIKEKSYTPTTAKDILSRCIRSNKYLKHPDIVDDYYVFKLQQSPEFCRLRPSVKSQIKKAITLLIEYNSFSSLSLPLDLATSC